MEVLTSDSVGRKKRALKWLLMPMELLDPSSGLWVIYDNTRAGQEPSTGELDIIGPRSR
jgi:hypothetical protein